MYYQIRQRIFKYSNGQSPTFPADFEVNLHFLPLQPFGMEPGGGRTAVRGEEATVYFNMNTGKYYVESKRPLHPLRVEEKGEVSVVLQGNCLTLKGIACDLDYIAQLLEAVYYLLPVLLNVEFFDPPYIERADGKIGSVAFRWELEEWPIWTYTTTQDKQEERFRTAWHRFLRVSRDGDARRLVAALHYFHTACRLGRAAETPGEFMAEALLNYAKLLEVLWGNSREEVRNGLRCLGYSDEEIEAKFIPAIVLRNQFGVAHPLTSMFTREELNVLHRYADRAEGEFREMLSKLLEAYDSGEFCAKDGEPVLAESELRRTIRKLRQYLDSIERRRMESSDTG